MFTGIIEDVGTVSSWQMRRGAGVLTLTTRLPLGNMKIGSSLAVNGVCLTVVAMATRRVTVDVSPETMKRTNFNKLKAGDPVNLERPLRLNDRLGGHLVTGHVDGVGVVEKIRKQGKFTFYSFRVPPALGRLLVPKGSVAVDGVSLTVNDCGQRYFSVAVIPHTLERTNLRPRRLGDKVNLETDLIGKYIQKLVPSSHETRKHR
jgi:riboflavin synthase